MEVAYTCATKVGMLRQLGSHVIRVVVDNFYFYIRMGLPPKQQHIAFADILRGVECYFCVFVN